MKTLTVCKWSLIVVVLALLTACFPKPSEPIVNPVKPKAPARTESAAGTAEQASRKSSEADSQSAVTEERVARARSAADDAKAKMKTALEEADRLRKQKSASENELLNLYNQLVAQDQKVGSILTDLTSAQTSLATERRLRKEANDLMTDMRSKIAIRDAETVMLRAQLEQSNAQSDAYYASAKDTAAKLQKAQQDVGIAEGQVKTWRNIALTAGGILLLLVLIAVGRRSILPV
jgi:hypothetical protein